MGEVFMMIRDPKIWVCDCGCSTFEIMSDGGAKCAACDAPHNVDGAAWSAQSVKSEPETFRDIQGNGSTDFARRRVASMATDEAASVVVVVRRDGSISTWSEAETQEQSQWVRDGLMQAADLIASKIEVI